MVYTARIKFVDDGSERNVSISDLLGEENLPYGYYDEDIFFYGLSQEQAKKALLSQEPCEGEWLILELDDLITGEIRPCMLQGTDVISGVSITEDEVQFWGVYRNNLDGTQTHILDTVTKEDAEHVLDLMNEFECFRLNKLTGAVMANRVVIPAEIQGKLEKRLAQEGFMPDGYVEQEITNQTNVPCPLCGRHVKVTCKGNSCRVDCKEHGTIISARGV